jgi:hypothetical protein
MRKQKQTIFGKGGNCFSTCVACLLDLQVEDVPNFCEKETWFNDCGEWLAERGYSILLCKEVSTGGENDWNGNIETLHIASGPANRGLPHSAIYKIDSLFWDPHPDGSGIRSISDRIFIFKMLEEK